jgi:predicted nucleic acid-binding protein
MRLESSEVPGGVATLTRAALYRTCRQGEHTVRKLIDCLIAAVAIRADVPILHRDADFDTLAQHTALRVEAL